ncbi:MAG: thioredoxin fold domain-containing protein [Ekhidna sp.]|nr:thioredoxin fold domain-containing protein [Ekhidna sp.]
MSLSNQRALRQVFLTITALLLSILTFGQGKRVQWLTFEQLEDSLEREPRKVFIDFYTDWCTYCRKMDQVVFTKSDVINSLNTAYYAVRFDAESAVNVSFGGAEFENDQIGKSRNPVHQIAQLLALRDSRFFPPTMIILDSTFTVKARYFEYMDSKKLVEALDL